MSFLPPALKGLLIGTLIFCIMGGMFWVIWKMLGPMYRRIFTRGAHKGLDKGPLKDLKPTPIAGGVSESIGRGLGESLGESVGKAIGTGIGEGVKKAAADVIPPDDFWRLLEAAGEACRVYAERNGPPR